MLAAVLLLALSAFFQTACGPLGWALDGLAGGPKPVEVDAEYEDLASRKVAILATAPPHVLYRHPNAPALAAKALGGRLAEHLPTAALTDPRQIESFQSENPYWPTMAYGELAAQLNVEGLIIIAIVVYSLHYPENRHVWRGRIEAAIGVAEAAGPDADSFAYTNTIRAVYPDRPLPLLDSDEQTIQFGVLSRFAQYAGGLFHDHEERR